MQNFSIIFVKMDKLGTCMFIKSILFCIFSSIAHSGKSIKSNQVLNESLQVPQSHVFDKWICPLSAVDNHASQVITKDNIK